VCGDGTYKPFFSELASPGEIVPVAALPLAKLPGLVPMVVNCSCNARVLALIQLG
jgi:hypothetical protein